MNRPIGGLFLLFDLQPEIVILYGYCMAIRFLYVLLRVLNLFQSSFRLTNRQTRTNRQTLYHS